MTNIQRTAYVPYSTRQLFELVDKIEEYPEFLPGCRQTEVHHRDEGEVTATIHVEKSGIRYSFTTKNCNHFDTEIEVRLVKGPFRNLKGSWRFEPVETGCRVSFNMEFIFANKLIDFTAGPILQKFAESFMDAFCLRAQEIYGKPS